MQSNRQQNDISIGTFENQQTGAAKEPVDSRLLDTFWEPDVDRAERLGFGQCLNGGHRRWRFWAVPGCERWLGCKSNVGIAGITRIHNAGLEIGWQFSGVGGSPLLE